MDEDTRPRNRRGHGPTMLIAQLSDTHVCTGGAPSDGRPDPNARLEAAVTVLTDTDLALRSAGRTAPAMALVERALIRLAMMRGR